MCAILRDKTSRGTQSSVGPYNLCFTSWSSTRLPQKVEKSLCFQQSKRKRNRHEMKHTIFYSLVRFALRRHYLTRAHLLWFPQAQTDPGVVYVHAQLLSPTLCGTVDSSLQSSLSMGFFSQEYWSGLLFPLPEVLDPGREPMSPLHCQVDSLSCEPPGNGNTQFPSILAIQSYLKGW